MGRRSRTPKIPNNPMAPDDDILLHEDALPEVEDRVAQDIEEEASDPTIQDLEDAVPPPIDPTRATTPIQRPDGTWTYDDTDTFGRAMLPPLWRDAHLHPAITQLRVWKVNGGNLDDVGTIDARADSASFIRHFIKSMPKPGEGYAEFVGRPLDNRGGFVAKEFPLGRFSDEHVDVLRIRRQIAAGLDDGRVQNGQTTGQPASNGLDLTQLLALVNNLTSPAHTATLAAQEEARAARDAMITLMKQSADERSEGALRLGASVEDLSEKLFEKAAASHDAEQARTAAFYAAAATAQQNDRERERDRAERERQADLDRRRVEREEMEAQRRREREEAEDKRKADLAEAAAKREQERLDAAAERERLRDEAKTKLEMIEAEGRLKLEQERNDAQIRMETFRAEQAAIAERERVRAQEDREERQRRDDAREADRARQHQLELENIRSRAEQDRQHQDRMAALMHRETPEGALGTISKLAGSFGVDIKDVITKYLSPEQPTDAVEAIEGVGKAVGDGLIKPFFDYLKVAKNAEVIKNQIPAVMHGSLPPAQIVGPQSGGGAPQQTTEEVAGQRGAPVGPITPQEPSNPASSLPLDVQKKARIALRSLVTKMKHEPQEKWASLISEAMALEGAIYHYLKQVGLTASFVEAGADPKLVQEALDNPLVAAAASDFPR